MKDVSLVNYFHKELSSLNLSPDLEASLISKFSQVLNLKIFQSQRNKLKILTRDETMKRKLKIIQSIDVVPSDIQSLEEQIEEKYRKIRELEKEIESKRDKIEIIDDYEQYLDENRKPGIVEKTEPIDYFLKQKKSSIVFINSILADKKNLHGTVNEIVSKIQELYTEIEDEERVLIKMTEVLENSKKKLKKASKSKKTDSFRFSRMLEEESNNTIPEASEENTKNGVSSKDISKKDLSSKNFSNVDISSSKSQVMIKNFLMSPESLNPTEISHSSKKNQSFKIQELKKVQPLDKRKVLSTNLPNFTKNSRIKLPELSRTNQERLAIIEGRLRYGEVLHHQISPTLERVKKLEKDAKIYYSPSSRNNDFPNNQGGYKSLSPRSGFIYSNNKY